MKAEVPVEEEREQLIQDKGDKMGFEDEEVKEIGTVNPLEDFKKMVTIEKLIV